MSAHSFGDDTNTRPEAAERISQARTFLNGYTYLRDASHQRQQKRYFKTLVRRSKRRIRSLQQKGRM